MSQLFEQNAFMRLLKDYSWLGEIQHELGDFNSHVEGLNKHFDQRLYVQLLASVIFKCDIVEKYKDVFLRCIPFINTQGGVVNTFIFQISHDLIVNLRLVLLKDELIGFSPEFHSTCAKRVYDFLVENEEFLVVEEKKAVGFGGI